MDSISFVNTPTGYDNNPGNFSRFVGVVQVRGMSYESVQTVVARFSSDEFSITRSSTPVIQGVAVNLFCKRSSVSGAEIEEFLSYLNLVLNGIRAAREAKQQQSTDQSVNANTSTRGRKPATVRIAAQQRPR